jgi:hypothetical protein
LAVELLFESSPNLRCITIFSIFFNGLWFFVSPSCFE